jgi:tetratricopeptide (TPR) repeat protein
MAISADQTRDRELQLAAVLTEIGELGAAEAEVLGLLHSQPDDREALSLLAKIKHIRGELSTAFACWARAHALAAEEGGAAMRLATMLRMAQDPERGAGEYLAVGQNHLWRKPASMLELERAFRLFVARRPDEAREACAQLAKANVGRDRELYKLATLAAAWMAELAGDLAGACETLERLGQDRGFENDVDRALALARVYEQRGGPEQLEKAIHVCTFLSRSLRTFERVTTLGRVAALQRALGRFDEAELYEAQFLEAFRARMHRPTRNDAIAAAARTYLPLDKLTAARFASGGWPERPTALERTLALALDGDLEGARRRFEGSASVLERKYLADLRRLEGDVGGAAEIFLATLADDPEDRRVLFWLLERSLENGARGPVDARTARHIRDYFHRPETLAATRRDLEAAIRESPRRPSAWRARAAILRIAGESAEADKSLARAQALGAAEARRESAVGRALSAAVYHFADAAKGLVHEVWAARRPAPLGLGGNLDEVFGNVTPELGQSVRNVFLSVREYALAKLPHLVGHLLDSNYSYKVTKEDEPSGGLSAGLPTALAFLSAFIDRPIRQDIASSGALVTDAHDVLVVTRVGEAEFKVRGAYNRNLRMVILPEASRADVERSHHVPRAIGEELVRYVPDLDAAVSLVFGDDVWVR